MHGKFRLQAAIVWRYPVFGCCFLSCVQCFCVSVIHQTLTWTTSSFTCIHSWGEAHQRVSTTFLTQKNSHFSCAPDGIWTSGHGNPLDLETDALPIEPPRPLSYCSFYSYYTHNCTLSHFPLTCATCSPILMPMFNIAILFCLEVPVPTNYIYQ